jgi:hypothetical protein
MGKVDLWRRASQQQVERPSAVDIDISLRRRAPGAPRTTGGCIGHMMLKNDEDRPHPTAVKRT